MLPQYGNVGIVHSGSIFFCRGSDVTRNKFKIQAHYTLSIITM